MTSIRTVLWIFVGCIVCGLNGCGGGISDGASPARFEALNDGTENFQAEGVSDDGLVVVGIYRFSAARWSGGQLEFLGPYPDSGPGFAEATAVSSDGSVLVGSGHTTGSQIAYRWSQPSGALILPNLPGGDSAVALDIQGPNGFVVGQARDAFGMHRPVRWNGPNEVEDLGSLPGTVEGQASSISDDGTVIVGLCDDQAFRYEAGIMQPLGGGVHVERPKISGNGQFIVGSLDPGIAYRWSAAMGFVSLGTLPGDNQSVPNGVSADGSSVVGYCMNSGNNQEAFLWRPGAGMRALKTVLQQGGNHAADTLQLWSATGITPDGHTIVGIGVSPGAGYIRSWKIYLP